jgi:hypothetical protein
VGRAGCPSPAAQSTTANQPARANSAAGRPGPAAQSTANQRARANSAAGRPGPAAQSTDRKPTNKSAWQPAPAQGISAVAAPLAGVGRWFGALSFFKGIYDTEPRCGARWDAQGAQALLPNRRPTNLRPAAQSTANQPARANSAAGRPGPAAQSTDRKPTASQPGSQPPRRGSQQLQPALQFRSFSAGERAARSNSPVA